MDKGKLLSNVTDQTLGKNYSMKLEKTRSVLSSFCVN